MAPLDSTARKQPGEPAPPYRAAPHNIEAEQALLGAILVNNEALYRVSDFLEPPHFFEPIHQQIYDIARSLIRTGKLASPVTLKTFLPAEIDIAGLTLAQYLARLAAEATTIINAVDYGRTIYDLAIRWGVGHEQIDSAGATELGIAVANAPTYGSEDVAEHAIALLLAVVQRRLARRADPQRPDARGTGDLPKFPLPELEPGRI